MTDEDVPRHKILLRGAGSEVYWHIKRAIHDGVEPPLEYVAGGGAGTGKSMGVLGALISIAHEFPNVPVRVLLARLTRRSLTTSTCVTIRKLLYPGHPMIDSRRDDNRTDFLFGAWTFALAGLDNVDNLLSTEWDFVVGEELRQFPKGVWEDITGRGLRNYAFFKFDADGNPAAPGEGVSRIPFGMALGMTNPGPRKHWILSRAKKGMLHLYPSVIQDNPAYYDMLPDGTYQRTLEGGVFERRREQYTGVRYQRMVLNLWTNAEGAIFTDWDDDLDHNPANVVRLERGPDGWLTNAQIRALDIREFYAGVDFGDDAPGCIVVAGYTGSKKLIVVAEAYARKKDLEWWCERVKEIHAHYPITLAWCDHNRSDLVRAFNDVVGAERDGPGSVFVLAHKQNKDRSIALLQLRVKHHTIQYDVDALVHAPDVTLVEAGLPVCTVDEFPIYVHDRKSDDDESDGGEKAIDKPDPNNHDHGIDATLYLVCGVDYLLPGKPMTTPDERKYLDRIKLVRSTHHAGHPAFKGGEYRDPVEDDDTTDEEWLRDQLRGGLL